MASITKDASGKQRIQFVAPDGSRKTIYLGKIARRAAEAIKVRVERIAASRESGCGLDRETAQWVADLDTKLAGKLSRVGLIEAPGQKTMPTLLEHLDRYFASRGDVKESTLTHWRQARRSLLDFFGADRRLNSINQGDAKDFERWLKTPTARKNSYSGQNKGLALNTVRKRCGDAKQFFADAVDREILSRNPFAGICGTVGGNAERQHFVDRDTVAKVISACPDFEWRLLVALARYGGLRNPSETLELCWADINWETRRMTVRSKKTEHHEGKGSRDVPVFPELRPFLEEAWELAEPGQKYVISRYRGNVNLRTQLQKIIKRAGVKPWPKLWQNLRSSRATELASACPAHVATAFLGHSIQVAQKHYWQVTDADFEKATQNTTQQAHAEGSRGSQPALEGNTETPVLPEDSAQCVALPNQIVGDTGLEPVTPSLSS